MVEQKLSDINHEVFTVYSLSLPIIMIIRLKNNLRMMRRLS